MMKDKSVFKLAEIDAEKLAKSYGLLNAPQLTIVSSSNKRDDNDDKMGSEEAVDGDE